jgi:dipeptidase E
MGGQAMKFYLSSFKVGNEAQKLLKLTQNGNRRVVYISNAMDYISDLEARNRYNADDISELEMLGFKVQTLDLRHYFGKTKELEKAIKEYDVIWVSGGNAFVLAQAMRLSGLDVIIRKLYEEKDDVVYGGYSAATYILGPSLKGFHIVDDPNEKPYGEQYDTIWEGLGIINYTIAPHYCSEHFESDAVGRSVMYLIDNKILFIALRDGEAIVIE